MVEPSLTELTVACVVLTQTFYMSPVSDYATIFHAKTVV